MVKLVIISPVRDEGAFIEKTITSVVNQTILPARWIIVDDGSKDETGAIIDQAALKHSFIRCIHRENRGFRKAGGGVIEAFYEGYRLLDIPQWDYIVKLDGDLSFDPDYFENCHRHFQKNSKLGIAGGDIYNIIDGTAILEKQPIFHVRGAVKMYSRKCWEQIGGLLQAPGWDTLDEVRANMFGFQTQSFKELKVLHYRPTGMADGIWKNAFKNGRANYICRYHPFYILIKCLKALFFSHNPKHAAGLFLGFISGYLSHTETINDKKFIHYLRSQQIRRIFGMKTIWK